MFNQTFYHSLTRSYVIAMGNCLNDIYIRRFDANNNTIQKIQVPIGYAPKKKWLAALDEDLNKPVAITLPRIGFYLNGINEDPTRKTSPLNRIINVSDKDNELFNSWNHVPYKFNFEVNILVKNRDDGTQIIEQIIPYFNPSFTYAMKLYGNLNKSIDTPIRLKNISLEEGFEGDFQKLQVISWNLQFEVDGWLLGPIQKNGIIKRIQIDFNIPPGDGPVTSGDKVHTGRSERLVVQPGLTANGTPTSNISNSIDYQDIQAEDDYGYIEEITNFTDGKKFNPTTLRDEDVKNKQEASGTSTILRLRGKYGSHHPSTFKLDGDFKK